MTVTASQVKELREMTACGMMDCKKALSEADGDLKLAAEILRKKGISKAASKAGRVAAEGVIIAQVSRDNHQAVLLEVNCETDFVARDENFLQFAGSISEAALSHSIKDVEVILNTSIDGEKTVDYLRQELVLKLGENIQVRRVAFVETTDTLAAYVHGGRLGAIVSIRGGDETLAKDIAMHVVANNPLFVAAPDVSPEVLAKEREICRAQALESGKPENIIDKMVEGRIKKFISEICLVNQPFVKNPDITVGDLLKEKGAKVESFIRMELGEGIEKKVENFAEEVMSQLKDK